MKSAKRHETTHHAGDFEPCTAQFELAEKGSGKNVFTYRQCIRRAGHDVGSAATKHKARIPGGTVEWGNNWTRGNPDG